MKKIVAFLALLFVLGCSAAETVLDGSAVLKDAAVKTSPSKPVQLYYAKTTTFQDSLGFYADMKGFVEIENLAFVKTLVVHYQTNGGGWSDAPAKYLKTLYGKEVWSFSVEGLRFVSNTTNAASVVRFAIRYTVNGKDYWDNNGGLDYLVRTQTTDIPMTGCVFGKSQVAMDHGISQIRPTGDYPSWFYCTAYVRSVGVNRQMRLRYTLDNWTNTLDIPGRLYGSTTVNGVAMERWIADVTLSASTTSVRFAPYAVIDGFSAWDNNFGMGVDYRVSLPTTNVFDAYAW